MFNLTFTIYTFYINEFIYGILAKETDSRFLKSHEKFRKEFLYMREKFNTILSNTLHDYIILVSAEELINSYKYCDFTVERFLGHNIWYCYNNGEFIQENFHKLHIPSFIQVCEEIFHNIHWNHELFGGEMWWTAIRYVRDIYPKDKVLFIDSVIDLEHNTSTLFNKSNPWFESCSKSILNFLEQRKNITDIYQLFNYLVHQGVGSKRCNYLAHLYRRFVYLYLPDLPNIDCVVRKYIPVVSDDFHEHYWKQFWSTTPTEFTGEYRQYNIAEVAGLPDPYEI